MTSLSLYRAEDEAALGLLDARDATQPGTLERTAAEAAIERHLGSLPVKTRVDTVCSILAAVESQMQGCDLQMMRLRQLKANFESRRDEIRNYMARRMSELGVKRLAGTAETLVLHTNPEAVGISDPDMIPLEFQTVKVTLAADHWNDVVNLLTDTGNENLMAEITVDSPTPKKSLIKAAIKRGEGVPGAFMDAGVSVVRK